MESAETKKGGGTRKIGSWEGGFITLKKGGLRNYYLRKQRGNDRIQINLRTGDPEEAYRMLKLFNANPEGFSLDAARAQAGAKKVLPFTEELVNQYIEFSESDKENEPSWARHKAKLLRGWLNGIRDKRNPKEIHHKGFLGRDLKNIRLEEFTNYIQILKERGYGQINHRRSTLKHFFSWLVSEGRIESHQNVTRDRLQNPQSRKMRDEELLFERDKRAYTKEQLLALRAHLQGHWADAATIQMGTGWHITEVRRLVTKGVVGEEQGVNYIAARHKRNKTFKLEVSPEVHEAAKKLKERGTFDMAKYRIAVKEAAAKVGIPEFTPRLYRHCAASYAQKLGAPKGQISTFLNHGSTITTDNYTLEITRKVIPTML